MALPTSAPPNPEYSPTGGEIRGFLGHSEARWCAISGSVEVLATPAIMLQRTGPLATRMASKADYEAFMRCLADSLNTFEVPEPERSEVVAFATSLEPEIVET